MTKKAHILSFLLVIICLIFSVFLEHPSSFDSERKQLKKELSDFKVEYRGSCSDSSQNGICLDKDKFILIDGEKRKPLKPYIPLGPAGIFIPMVCFVIASLTKKIFWGFIYTHIFALIYFVISGFSSHLIGSIERIFFSSFKIQILAFTILLITMGKIMLRNGAVDAVFDFCSKKIKSRAGVQLMAYLNGLLIFFDDYANTVIVGTSFQSIFDRFKISRAKLAYIVDSTAAPLAGIMLFSTWIGFEIECIKGAIETTSLDKRGAYEIFLESVPFRLYCIFALMLVFIGILSGREFPAMSRSKIFKPSTASGLANDEIHRKSSLLSFVLPLIAVLSVMLVGLILESKHQINNYLSFSEWRLLLQNIEDISPVLLAASSAGLLISLLFVLPRPKPLKIVKESFSSSFSVVFPILGLLFSAWFIADLVKILNTPDYILLFIPDGIAPNFWPLIVFLLAASISFTTGSSWTVMGVLLPLMIPLLSSYGLDQTLLVISVAMIMDGAVFGDHVSPISDTTVMSSLSSGCDLIEHVKTQLPYALLAAFTSIILLQLSLNFSLPILFLYLVAGISMYLTLKSFGLKS